MLLTNTNKDKRIMGIGTGRSLKALRVSTGVKQTDLALELRISSSYLSLIEAEKRRLTEDMALRAMTFLLGQ
jgi:transcriptional regulator with XRE-family HTH domain